MKFLVVIVNYRTAGLVQDCLRSIAEQVVQHGQTRVVVVDNASGDDSVDRLRCAITTHGWGDWATVHAAPRNGGFAYGNNEGIRAGQRLDGPADVIWLLNPDTIVRPEALAAVEQFLAGHPRAGIVGTRLEDLAGAPECSAHRRLSLWAEFDMGARVGPLTRLLAPTNVSPPPQTTAHGCDWVSGASLVVRRAVLDQVGLLDDGYFLYYEEVDLCERARRAGWELWYLPDACVVHREGAATGLRERRRMPRYWFDSRRRYFAKHHGAAGAALMDAARLGGMTLGAIVRLFTRMPDEAPPHLFGDLLRHALRSLRPGRSGEAARARRAGVAAPPEGLAGAALCGPDAAELPADPLAATGIIVIGRNEAPRLPGCLAAVAAYRDRTVYVDSGSSDGSPRSAEAAGVHVIRITSGPFTAARGRQVGLDYFARTRPELAFVQFVDGDCELDGGWLPSAATFLAANPGVAVVTGRLRERHAENSVLVRLVDADWDLPTGAIDAIGGISLARLAALRAVGGWRTDLIAGEELDLGVRLRKAGWTLYRLPNDMTWHDIGIRRFGELWRRSIRSGYTYAALAALHGDTVPRWRRRALGNVAYGAVLPLVAVLGLAWWWPASLAVLGLYGLLVARVALRRWRGGDTPGFAGLYAAVLLLEKFAGAWGTLKHAGERVSGRATRLIEYKQPGPAPSVAASRTTS